MGLDMVKVHISIFEMLLANCDEIVININPGICVSISHIRKIGKKNTSNAATNV